LDVPHPISSVFGPTSRLPDVVWADVILNDFLLADLLLADLLLLPITSTVGLTELLTALTL